MNRDLERVTLATYGDPTRAVIHIDVREMQLARTRETDTLANRRRTARLALADLRAVGIEGLIIAHVNGMPGAGA